MLHSNITAIEQVDDHHFFIATEVGVRYVKLENGILETIPVETLDYFHAQVSELYFHKQLKRLFIGSFEKVSSVRVENLQISLRSYIYFSHLTNRVQTAINDLVRYPSY